MVNAGHHDSQGLITNSHPRRPEQKFRRPILAGGKAEANALWLAINGKPISYASIGEPSPKPQG